MSGFFKRAARRLPWLRDLHRYIVALETERDQLRADLAHWKMWMSPGHFYSPIPSLEEVRAREAELFGPPPPSLPGIDLREQEQIALIKGLARFYGELPFPRTQSAETRYWFENWAYSYADAIFLYSMLRHLEPRRVIEVGSGFSSAAMLDTAERWLPETSFTFIDPDTSTLDALLRPGDRERVSVIRARLQDVPLTTFDALVANDILFIDSTHVSKTGSDVNRIVFDILPRLAPGVHVHFHDVFYPFEYPKEWVYEGRAWNEDYILRAFLEYNGAFEIVLFGTWLARFHRDLLQELMPLTLENPGGSLWLTRRS
ncbi:MAG TPA: class I SAM-dependent methyltransferase [Thermoanaerobaculia bacterium]|nr:class I SAM-dependent methyltransferase [Thermoanaerobaculia bacterium]